MEFLGCGETVPRRPILEMSLQAAGDEVPFVEPRAVPSRRPIAVGRTEAGNSMEGRDGGKIFLRRCTGAAPMGAPRSGNGKERG